MRSRYTVREPERAHFVTSTIVDWLPVFRTAACCDILAGPPDFCRREKGLLRYAWGHHGESLSRRGAGRRSPARHGRSQEVHRRPAPRPARSRAAHLAPRPPRRRQGRVQIHSSYQLWQEGYHPQAIYSDQTMLQKIDYIHANPVRRGWVASPEHWRYSSANEWLQGSQAVLRCDPWR